MQCSPLPTKPSSHLRAGHFFLVASRLAFADSQVISVASNEKITSGTQGSRWWSIQVNQVNVWKTIHTTWAPIPGSDLNLFEALISQLLKLCITSMINQIFIFIPSYLFLFLYFFLPLKITFLYFLLFFNSAYFIYPSLAPALYSGKEITDIDSRSL